MYNTINTRSKEIVLLTARLDGLVVWQCVLCGRTLRSQFVISYHLSNGLHEFRPPGAILLRLCLLTHYTQATGSMQTSLNGLNMATQIKGLPSPNAPKQNHGGQTSACAPLVPVDDSQYPLNCPDTTATSQKTYSRHDVETPAMYQYHLWAC